MLCWFLVAKSSITNRFENIPEDEDSANHYLKVVLDKMDFDLSKIEEFFTQISALFNFLTPFINGNYCIIIVIKLINILFN